MAIPAVQFKAGMASRRLVALSCSGFLAIVSIARPKKSRTASEQKRP
jgi:hypothetical protein